MTLKSQPSSFEGRTPFLIVALLAILLLILGARGVAAQVGCSGPSGETGVAVDLIRAGGLPVIESTDTIRREYAHITSGLRDALGITVPADPQDDARPQIRVIVETATLGSGLRSTATFTVEAVIADPALRVEVYDRDPAEGATDDDSGVSSSCSRAAWLPAPPSRCTPRRPAGAKSDLAGKSSEVRSLDGRVTAAVDVNMRLVDLDFDPDLMV